MLKCLLLSLGLLMSVSSVPLEIETEPSIAQEITTDESTMADIEEVVTEETAYSQETVDTEDIPDSLIEELFESSDELQDQHTFVLDNDIEETNLAEAEEDDIKDTVIAERKLEKLNTSACAQRPSNFSHGVHSYWFPGTMSDWLSARNICRGQCMDLVSIETPAEHTVVADYLIQGDLAYIWTSGRLCNFRGCDRPDLQPISVAGWFWSGSGVRIAPTNSTPPFWGFQPWSHTGHKSQFYGRDIPQPDNAEEEINGSTEACLAVFNDVYDDGVAWHDAACYHKKMFLCEDVDNVQN